MSISSLERMRLDLYLPICDLHNHLSKLTSIDQIEMNNDVQLPNETDLMSISLRPQSSQDVVVLMLRALKEPLCSFSMEQNFSSQRVNRWP